MRSILPAIQELERCFEEFRVLFSDCQFPSPVIAIQSKGRKNALGWFVGDKWSNETDESIAEITISAEHLKGTVEQIAEVLLHEMCHYANRLKGINDCTVNQYHNAHFRTQAESIGLVVTKGPRGWAYTELGSTLIEIVNKAKIDPEAFSLFRKGQQVKKQVGKMKKWRCRCTNIRAATPVDAVCQKCGQTFQKA